MVDLDGFEPSTSSFLTVPVINIPNRPAVVERPALPVHTRVRLLSALVPVHVANLLSINTECRAPPHTCVPLPSGTTRLEDFPL